MRSKYLGHRGSKAGHNVGESWTRDDGTRVTKVGPNQYREESPGGMAGRPAVQHEDQSRLPPAVRERAQQASDGMTAQMQDATDMASHRLAGEGASPQQQAAARQSVLGALGRGIRGMLQEYGQAHARDNPDMNRGPLHLASWAVTRAWQALRRKLGGKALLRRQAKFLHLAKDFDPEAAQQAAGDIQGLLDTLAGHLSVTAPKIDARELYSGGKGLWGHKWLGRRSSKAKRRERNKPYELHGEWWIIGDDNKRRPYRPGGAAGGGAAPAEEPAGQGTQQGSQPRARRRKQPAEPPVAKARVKTRQDTHGLTTELPPLSEARRQELAPAIDKAIAQAMLYSESRGGVAPLHLVVRELQRAVQKYEPEGPRVGGVQALAMVTPPPSLAECYAAIADLAEQGKIYLHSCDSGWNAMQQAQKWGQGELPVEEAAIWRNGNPMGLVESPEAAAASMQEYDRWELRQLEQQMKDKVGPVSELLGKWFSDYPELQEALGKSRLDKQTISDAEKIIRQVMNRYNPRWQDVPPEDVKQLISDVHERSARGGYSGMHAVIPALISRVGQFMVTHALDQLRTAQARRYGQSGKYQPGGRAKHLRCVGRKSHDLADRIWQAIRFSGPMREITATREQDDDSIDMLVQEIEDEARYAGSTLDAEQIWDDIYDAVHRHQGYDRAEAIQRVLRMAIREAGHLSKSLTWQGKAARYKPGEVRTRKDGSKWTLNPATGKVERVRGEGQGSGRKKEEALSGSPGGGDDDSIDLSGWDNPNADESGIDLSGWDNPNADESGIDLSGWDKEDARTKESRQLLSRVQQGISSLKWTREEEAAIHRQAESHARQVGPQRAFQMMRDIERKADQQRRSLKEAGIPDTVVATLNQVLIATEMADQGMPLPDSYIQRLFTAGQNALAYLRIATSAGHQGKSLTFYGSKVRPRRTSKSLTWQQKAQRRKEGEIWKRRDGTEWTKLNGRIVPHRQPGQGRGGRPQPPREAVGKLQSGLQGARGDLAKLILRDDQKAVSKLVASQFQQAGIKVNPGRVQRLVASIVDKHGDITSQGDAHTIAENITRQARQQAAKLAVVPRGPRQAARPTSEPQAEAGEQQQLERLKQFPGPDVIRSIDEQSAKLPVDRQQALARAFVLLAQSQEELLDQARTPRDQLQTLQKLTRMAVDTLGRFGIQIPQEKLTEYGLR